MTEWLGCIVFVILENIAKPLELYNLLYCIANICIIYMPQRSIIGFSSERQRKGIKNN